MWQVQRGTTQMARIDRKTEAPEPLMTIREVAVLDHCSEKTVRRAIEAGLLEAVRLGPGGRLLRISRRVHEAYRLGLRP